MQNAPPVVFPVGRFAYAHWILVILSVGSALALGIWQAMTLHVLQSGGWILWGVSVVIAFRIGPKECLGLGDLIWDGQAWHWRDARGHETPVDLKVLLDSGPGLGVMVRMPKSLHAWPHRFAWLRLRDKPSAWHGLRCAVYSNHATRSDSAFVTNKPP